MRVRFADLRGVRTRFLVAGEGLPLVLLHGVGMSGDIFVRNFAPLAECCTVYAPDMLGHGFTDSVAFANAVPQRAMAEHVNALADELGLDRYVIGGTSFGALVAALAYISRPERVAGLVLIGSGSCFHTAEDQANTLRAAAANAAGAMGDPTLQSCRNRLAAIVFDPATIADEILLVQLTSYALPDRFAAYRETIERSIATMNDEGSRILDRLESLDVPTLIITGRDDIRANWESHVSARDRMPQATLEIYENTGHMPFMEQPDQFNRDVRAFIGTLSGCADPRQTEPARGGS